MPPSKTVVQRVNGNLEDEHGTDHSVELDIEVLETFVDQITGIAKREVSGIRHWHGAKLPDGNYVVKFLFEGKMQRQLKRMVKGVLRNR